MPIEVVCPNGHALKIKEKYAGQYGLCPRCRAPIAVPSLEDDDEEEGLIDLVPRPQEKNVGRRVADQKYEPHYDHEDALSDDEDESPRRSDSLSETHSGESLLSSSIIKRNQKICPHCFQSMPVWFIRCTNCNHFF